MTEQEFDAEGKTSMSDFPMAGFEHFIRNKIVNDLHRAAVDAMKSDEYNFNDTAIRSKTFFLAADIARGKRD
jgi:hypothetical protein